MENVPLSLRIYTKRDGTSPLSEWLDGLKDVQGRQAIRSRLLRLEMGSFGDCKKASVRACGNFGWISGRVTGSISDAREE